jgi:hypothetical protein
MFSAGSSEVGYRDSENAIRAGAHAEATVQPTVAASGPRHMVDQACYRRRTVRLLTTVPAQRKIGMSRE